jgi:ATP-dependent Clp protease adaptor protein ClpS
MRTSPKRKENLKQKNELSYSLILHNDDKNTFEYIIESLIEICHHDPYQASQCALLAHYKGKCDIKRGKKENLQKLASYFNKKNIQVTLE